MHKQTAGALLETGNPSPEDLDRFLAAQYWYHRMQLTHGRETPGAYGDNLLPVARLLRHVPLDGMQCLDIGAMDGKMSFLMERLGGDVLAVDGVGKETITALARLYGSSVRYRSGVLVESLPDLLSSESFFDFILCSGVAYHVYSPFDLLANVRALLRTGGVALFETAALPDDEHLYMSLNRGNHYREHTTLWIPTTACFRYMLRFLSMRILGEAQLHMRDARRVVRHAWLVQAEKPSVLEGQTDDPWLQTLLRGAAPGWSHEYLKPQLDLARFETRPHSRITIDRIPESPALRLDAPETYLEEQALLATGTPAWRLLHPRRH